KMSWARICAVCGVGFGPCLRMLWRHARGWFRVFSGLGSGLVSWLVGSVTVVTGVWASFELHDADRLVESYISVRRRERGPRWRVSTGSEQDGCEFGSVGSGVGWR